MTEHKALDPVLKGRTADPAVREGIALVEYPEYLIAEVLSGDGLREVHSRINAESLTPEAAARAITDMIVERLTEDIPEETPSPAPEKTKPSSFVPHFPKPVISKLFGRRSPAPEGDMEDPVFEEDAAPMNFESPVKASLLMRAEAVTQQWRRGKVSDERAAHLLESAVRNYQKRQQER